MTSTAKLHNRRRTDTGAAAVEFAIILPLLVMLVFGIIEFGRGYNAKVSLTHAAREGARALAVGTADDDGVKTVIKDSVGSLDPEKIEFSAFDNPCTNGEPTKVTLTYQFKLNIPFLPTPDFDLESTGVMRCER
jgi:Flp pilus assembly protein TadG